MAVHSMTWQKHLKDIDCYLDVIKHSGLTLNISKCEFGKPLVKYVGLLIGSGQRLPDPTKVEAIMKLKIPQNKKQVRQLVGLFSHFRDYIPLFSEMAKPITDLTGKGIPARIPWGDEQWEALSRLQNALCKAAECPLQIINHCNEFSLYVDSSDFAIGCMITQFNDEGIEKPVAFASSKLSSSQRKWAVIEKEAYAAIWSLQRFRHWLFAAKIGGCEGFVLAIAGRWRLQCSVVLDVFGTCWRALSLIQYYCIVLRTFERIIILLSHI
jgi:hypothetical protein